MSSITRARRKGVRLPFGASFTFFASDIIAWLHHIQCYLVYFAFGVWKGIMSVIDSSRQQNHVFFGRGLDSHSLALTSVQ